MQKYDDISFLREILDANYCTGVLIWKRREPSKHGVSINRFNALYAGKQAFNTTDRHGYLVGSVGKHRGRKYFFAHRVIWAIYYGRWPDGEIDHIDGNKKNNSIDNLRCVTRKENAKNLPRPRHNTSGICGVRKTRSGWNAYIQGTHLGCFSSIEDARSARKIAEQERGFHQNHGRIAA